MEAGRRYTESRRRISALVAGLPPSDLDREVPATPGRTVRGLLEHLVGVAADITGAQRDPGDPGRTDVAAVLEEWGGMGLSIESAADGSLQVGDCLVGGIACHEHDLRGALGRPGERDTATVDQARQTAMLRLHERLKSAVSTGLRLRAGESEWILGLSDPAATLTTDPFTLFRALFGRRSRRQLAALAWTSDPEPYLDLLGQCPPLVVDLVE